METGISVVLLAYREADNLKILIPKIKENLVKAEQPYEILVVDTKEPLDDTPKICQEYDCRYINQEEPNFGGAFRTGIKYAQKDKCLFLDADGSHDPKYIPDLIRKFNDEHCDVVIGSRYVDGGQTFDAKSSIVMSRILNTVFRFCLGIKAKDISTDYRLYHTEDLKAVELENKNYDILQEVLLKIQLNYGRSLKIGEVPISFQKRVYGESKRRLIPFIIDYIKSLVRLTFLRFPGLRNFVLYGIFGLIAAGLEYAVFALLLHSSFIKQPEFCNIIGSICGFIFAFSANTYKNFSRHDRFFFRLVSYGLICLCGIAFSTMIISHYKSSANLYLVKAILLVVVSCVQFILNKKITYRE